MRNKPRAILTLFLIAQPINDTGRIVTTRFYPTVIPICGLPCRIGGLIELTYKRQVKGDD
jgi:hypothetical protein